MILIAGKTINQKGFALIAVLVAVSVSVILAETAYRYSFYQVNSEKEKELLFRGKAYRNAIYSFYTATSAGNRRFPQSLDELISDPRFPSKHHIRHLYKDPFSKKEWRIIRDKSGGIRGVASSSQGKPLRKTGFSSEFEHFKEARTYSDWIFEY